jgi:transposase
MLAIVRLDERVPKDHALRPVKALTEEVLRELDPLFDEMYSKTGRPSIPPERLLKALLLMALFGVRSERQFCDQLGYNMLFLWFMGMDLSEEPFDASTFSKNRARFEKHEVAQEFFRAVVNRARRGGLLDSEHFSVDGTLIEAWGSTKSFRPKTEDDYDSRGFPDFRGQKRLNDTHESKTDPDARLYRKGRGREAKLSHMAHTLIENQHGLVVDAEVTGSTGTAEREAAVRMLKRETERRAKKRKARKNQKKARKKNRRRATIAADKAYDTKDFVKQCRRMGFTPHVAQKSRYSAIDGRTTRHASYRTSLRKRLLVEKPFGWLKTAGNGRRSRYRGRDPTRQWVFFGLTALNILRIARLEAV